MKTGNKKAIVVLGGGLVKDESGVWHTTGQGEGDNFGSLYDRLRVVAASYLYQDHPERLIIASGGKGQMKDIPDAPNIASVIRRELVELGVPKEKIIEEGESWSTLEQLRGLEKIIKTIGCNELDIISNEYHLPRIEAMLENLPELSGLSGAAKIEIISAEKILIGQNPEKWEKIIEKIYQSEGMEKRIAMEEQGTKDLKEGKYKIR